MYGITRQRLGRNCLHPFKKRKAWKKEKQKREQKRPPQYFTATSLTPLPPRTASAADIRRLGTTLTLERHTRICHKETPAYGRAPRLNTFNSVRDNNAGGHHTTTTQSPPTQTTRHSGDHYYRNYHRPRAHKNQRHPPESIQTRTQLQSLYPNSAIGSTLVQEKGKTTQLAAAVTYCPPTPRSTWPTVIG